MAAPSNLLPSFSCPSDASSRHPLSSPTRASSKASPTRGKERRQPSITPRKFRRFFTPRARVPVQPSAARRALRDLTARALNSHRRETLSHEGLDISGCRSVDENVAAVEASPLPRPVKRRRTNCFTPETSPLKLGYDDDDNAPPQGLQHKKHCLAAAAMPLSPLASSPPHCPDVDERLLSECDEEDMTLSDTGSMADDLNIPVPALQRIEPLARRGINGQLLQRQLGTLPGPGYRGLAQPIADWRSETADFSSSPSDVYLCTTNERTSNETVTPCIPFCAAACSTNGIVAIGDEDGGIRLLDTDASAPLGITRSYLSFPAHGNAVIDLAFSDDDHRLATASGDQTGRVIDMLSQTPLSILDHHTASLKQVRFQPGRGGGNVLATSGRDGSIKIWDLRCHGGPAQEIPAIEWTTGLQYGPPKKVNPGCVVNSIYNAHARATTRLTRQTRQQQVLQRAEAAAAAAALAAAATAEVGPRWETPGRAGEVSVTAIQFLPVGREHLLLSACEADASIKVWDIRNVYSTSLRSSGSGSSAGAATPVAMTAPPESHSQWRPFGMSSLSLNTNGTRLYGMCKDNTVYAYSTAHIVLGAAPEPGNRDGQFQALQRRRQQQSPPLPARRRHAPVQELPGPLYGFRHESLHAATFYVKSAVRPARDGRSELLAVGSSDGCALLFPTDERYVFDELRRQGETQEAATPLVVTAGAATVVAGAATCGPARRSGTLFQTNSTSSLASVNGGSSGGRLVDKQPIVQRGYGTALVRGHEKKEVGSVCWTQAGRLVTVGDDCTVRCWRADDGGREASTLRTCGEFGGRRWGSGWAEVEGDRDAAATAEEEDVFI